jgi:hypothetical protein
MAVFKLFEPNEFQEEMNIVMDLAKHWENLKTRTSIRKIYKWGYLMENHEAYVPEELDFIQPLIHRIIQCAKDSVPKGDKFIPIQMFCCYYDSGQDSCPMHKHNTRQITVSFGSPRDFKVNSKTITIPNGHAIILHRERHGLPKSDERDRRLSFNLFYTTTSELRQANVNA